MKDPKILRWPAFRNCTGCRIQIVQIHNYLWQMSTSEYVAIFHTSALCWILFVFQKDQHTSSSPAVPCPRFVLLQQQGRRRSNLFQETLDLGLRCKCWTKTSQRFARGSGSAHTSLTFSSNRQLQHHKFWTTSYLEVVVSRHISTTVSSTMGMATPNRFRGFAQH